MSLCLWGLFKYLRHSWPKPSPAQRIAFWLMGNLIQPNSALRALSHKSDCIKNNSFFWYLLFYLNDFHRGVNSPATQTMCTGLAAGLCCGGREQARTSKEGAASRSCSIQPHSLETNPWMCGCWVQTLEMSLLPQAPIRSTSIAKGARFANRC